MKNAPSIFQRAIDDVLREHIGKFCHVYVDDIIIFSENEEDHVKHIDCILQLMHDANMRISHEKSKFFKKNVEYLGFVVSANGISTAPSKTEAIKKFKTPTTLFALRSFHGLASYYRCFIKDFAKTAKPLTDILKGDNGKVSAQKSKKILIELEPKQVIAFEKIKQVLTSEDVLLMYPDFKKPFDLTTDASASGLGAVLSQEGRPIVMISRTLRGPEINFATNERELLAIVWAQKKIKRLYLRNKNLEYFY